MIPQRVIDHWRRQGKSEEWIQGRIEAFRDDCLRREGLFVGVDLPKAEHLFYMYHSFDTTEIAELYNCSKTTVWKVLSGHPDYVSGLPTKRRQEKIARLLREGVPKKDIAREAGVSVHYVNVIARQEGLTQPRAKKPIGCERCKVDEYARGLCKSCYSRWIRRGKPDLDVVQRKKKPGPK